MKKFKQVFTFIGTLFVAYLICGPVYIWISFILSIFGHIAFLLPFGFTVWLGWTLFGLMKRKKV
jgi:hypothetical protein